MQVCAQRHEIALNGRMFPSNSGSKPHKAYAWRDGAAEVHGCFCSCQAFIFGRSKIAKAEGVSPQEVTFVCKHLQQIFDQTCDWHQTIEAEYRYDRRCPKCGGDVVDADDALIPTDEAGAVDDLRAMLAEMNGEEPPAPLPKPKPFTVTFTMTTTYRGTVSAMDAEEAASMHGDLYGMPGVEEVAVQCIESSAVEGALPPTTKKVTRARKATAKPTSAKIDPAGAAAAAAALASTATPRKRKSA